MNLPLLLLTACNPPIPETVDELDPTFVFEATGHADVATDTPYLAERPTLFRTADALPVLDVRAIAVGADVWAGTASGLYRLDGAAFAKVALPGGDGVVTDLEPLDDGTVAVVVDGRLDRVDASGVGSTVATGGLVRAVTSDGTTLWAVGDGLWRIDGAITELDTRSWHDVAVGTDQSLWIADAGAAGTWEAGTFVKTTGLPDSDVRAIASRGNGVVIGTSTGIAVRGNGDDDEIVAEIGGLPTGDVRALTTAGELVLIGHGEGATAWDLATGRKDHYHGERWLPDDTVTAVATGPDGARWIATRAGIARIDLVETTLADKALALEAEVDRFWRLDFVADEGTLADPWSPEAPLALGDFDNDGLWTQMQIAAWSYAYGATGDAAHCDRARRAIGMMQLQVAIPSVNFEAVGRTPGFVARSLVRDDETALFAEKSTLPNWHVVEGYEGHDWAWKDDTSSDETTGHFFGTPVYYDLCATDAEREVLAAHAGLLAGRIVDDGFQLIDLDGERTTWGYWDPDHVNIALDGVEACTDAGYPADDCLGAAYGAGWLQSIEILGHLLAAWHMTGDAKFLEAYQTLVLDERYAEAAAFTDAVLTVSNPRLANHSDHELAMLAYHTLIRYEPNDARRAQWIASLEAFYAWEKPERNPLWAAIVAGATPQGYGLDDAVDTLRVMPMDRRAWRMDNSHRVDVGRRGLDRFDEPQFDTVLPYDEIRTMKWNGNPYVEAAGGDGREVQAPWPWLLPYWMSRYHGILQ